jgi:hypothetical protein
MNEDEPMPECPEFPSGLTLSEKRRIVNRWGAELNAWRFRHFLAVGIDWVEWLGGAENECPACKAASGKVMRIHELDVEMHQAACTCEEGCACICIAVMGPEVDD